MNTRDARQHRINAGTAARRALFYRTRCEWRNRLWLLRAQSRLKIGVIFFFVILFELGLFRLFHGGFRFIQSLGGPGLLILGRLFAVYFLSMALMMSLSSLVAAYGALFRSRDVAFLITAPLTPGTLMLHKWGEVTRLSAWAYVFVVGPFVAAYAVYEGFSLLFVLWTLLFSVPLLLFCSALGMLCALLLARCWPASGRLRRLLQGALMVLAAAGLFWILRGLHGDAPRETLSWRQIVPGLRLAAHPLLPGYWMSEGLIALHRGAVSRGLAFLFLLCAQAAFAGLLLEVVGGRLLYTAWSRIQSATRRPGGALFFRPLDVVLRILPPDIHALVVKDLRMFVRDPLQWSQSLIFFGLLAAYFANLRNFHYHALNAVWLNFVAFLNAFSVSAVLCSLASRFVYPQMSLEGQAFWIIGLSPSRPVRVLLTKFAVAFLSLAAATLPLMLLSTRMLQTPSESRIAILVLMGCITLSITGLATGLGAVYLDLEHRNPAAVVSGFGGTLNLVLNLLVTILVLLPAGMLFHHHAAGSLAVERLQTVLRFLLPGQVLFHGIVTLGALWIGARSLSKRDY